MTNSTSYILMQHFQFAPVGFQSGFFGGQAVSIKLGTKSPQFYYSRHIDVRSEPSQFSVLPAGVPVASNNIIDLILDMDQINSGVRYAVGDKGNVYQVATNGVWSNIGNIGQNSGAGLVFRADVDHVYLSGQSGLSRIKRVSSVTNNLQVSWFQYGQSIASSCNKSGGANTYTPSVTLAENTANMRTFTSDIEPLYQLAVRVISKGTGNWTLTLHNDANDVLATVIVTNANITNGQWLYFVFASPITIQRGDLVGTTAQGSAQTYHFHITSTVADGTLATTTASSLTDCDMQLYAYALVTPRNGLHPILNFLNYSLIGNGRYVTRYEPLQDNPQMGIDYFPHKLTLPPGYEVCGFAQSNLLCVIAAEKRSTSGEFQDGALFFWDGISAEYNDWWPVHEGAPEGIFSAENTVYFMAGGALYYLQGHQPVKVRNFRGTNSDYSNLDETTHTYPHMMAVRRNILHFGYPSYTTNQALEHGISSYGNAEMSYPVSWTFDHTLSTGSRFNNGSNNLKIGMIKSYGTVLYISWRDDSHSPAYGVDVITNSSPPYSDATIESLIFDGGGRLAYSKKASILVAIFDTLPAGCTAKLKYKIDREANWHYSDDIDKTQAAQPGDTFLVMPIDLRFAELQYGMDLVIGATTPNVKYLSPFIDYQILERPVGAGSLDG